MVQLMLLDFPLLAAVNTETDMSFINSTHQVLLLIHGGTSGDLLGVKNSCPHPAVARILPPRVNGGQVGNLDFLPPGSNEAMPPLSLQKQHHRKSAKREDLNKIQGYNITHKESG